MARIPPYILEFHLYPGCLIGCLFRRAMDDEAGGFSRDNGEGGRIGCFDEAIRAETIDKEPEAKIFFAKGLSTGSRAVPASVSQNDSYRISFRQIAIEYVDGQALLPGSDVRFRVPSYPEGGASTRGYARIVSHTGCVGLWFGPITGKAAREHNRSPIVHPISADMVDDRPSAPCARFHVPGGSEFTPAYPFANPGFALAVSAVWCRIHGWSAILLVVFRMKVGSFFAHFLRLGWFSGLGQVVLEENQR